MPDNDFEQQARDMVNSFEMEPSPSRWQYIRNAIGKPKHRRRVILWWLLPVCMAGGIIVYMLTRPAITKEVAITVSPATATPLPEKNNRPEQEREPDANNNTIQKENRVTMPPARQNGKTIKTQQITVSNKRFYPTTVKQKDTASASGKNPETIASGWPVNKIFNMPADSSAHSYAQDSTAGNVTAYDIRTATGSSNNISAENKNMDSSGSDFAKRRETPATDSTIASNKMPGQLTDSSLQHSIASVPSGIQKPARAWQWGIMVEAGIAARNSSILSIGSSNSTDKNAGGLFYLNNPGNVNSGGLSGTSDTWHSVVQTRGGAAFGFGLALQKKLNRHFSLFADVGYHHQSVRLTAITYNDSLLLNNTVSSVANSYEATQSFRFLSAYAGLNWQFIKRKAVTLGISTGIDNLFLIGAQQKINGNTGGNTSRNDLQRVSDSTFSKSGYHRYQPGLFAGLLININTGSTAQLQFVPFVRSSLVAFEKQTTAVNNHLFSAGLRAVYLFK